jgi:hypothetical protein
MCIAHCIYLISSVRFGRWRLQCCGSANFCFVRIRILSIFWLRIRILGMVIIETVLLKSVAIGTLWFWTLQRLNFDSLQELLINISYLD